MKRGEIWTVAGPGYAGKPRPAVIVQDDRFDTPDSVTICLFTTDETDAPLFRLLIRADERSGLRQDSRIMADKLLTIPRRRLGTRVGELTRADVVRLNRALVIFLGIAS